jgi:hypothetical protein
MPDAELADVPVVWLDGKPHAYTVWGEDRDRDRRLLRKYVKSVTLAKADPKRRRWQPIAERVQIEWVGGVELVELAGAPAPQGCVALASNPALAAR